MHKLLLIVIFSFTILMQVVWAEPLTLILDVRDSNQLPKRFRTTADLVGEINLQGFTELNIAGGAQFSKRQLENILARLKTNKLTVIDLREESHGFINGNAVSWFGMQDAPNKGKSHAEIEGDQNERLSNVRLQGAADVCIVLEKKHEKITRANHLYLTARQVSSEEQIVKNLGLDYRRLYVTDHQFPSVQEVDRFIDIVKRIPLHQWIYLHCEMGIGRTTTFLVMYDMMHNAKRVSIRDILSRQAAIGGKDFSKALDETDTLQQMKRIDFLKLFYQYAKENTDNFHTSYSAWLSKRSLQVN